VGSHACVGELYIVDKINKQGIVILQRLFSDDSIASLEMLDGRSFLTVIRRSLWAGCSKDIVFCGPYSCLCCRKWSA
jgi:hypothetical protein